MEGRYVAESDEAEAEATQGVMDGIWLERNGLRFRNRALPSEFRQGAISVGRAGVSAPENSSHKAWLTENKAELRAAP